MDTTFQLPVNTILHAQPQHEPRNHKEQSSLPRPASRLFDRYTNGALSPHDKALGAQVTHGAAKEAAYTRHDKLSPYDALGIYNKSDSESRSSGLGKAMGGRTRVRPRGESDLGRPTPISRSLTTYESAYSAIPETPVESRYVFENMAHMLIAS
jgi:hypothetical protein